MNQRNIVVGLSILTAILLSGCATKTVESRVYNHVETIPVEEVAQIETEEIEATPIETNSVEKMKFKRVTYGKASWYGRNLDGRRTASGEIFSSNKKTAAHKTLPFNTMVKVTDMVTNKSEIVRINDRGPYRGNRIIDLSFAGAKRLGLIKRGVTDVKLEIVGSNGKIYKNLLSLSTPSESCIGDDCKASIKGEERVTSTSPTTWAETPPPQSQIESVYEERDIEVHSPNSLYSSSRSVDVVEHDSYVSNSINRFPKVSVQVGAFRKYSGAKVYVQRYNMSNSQQKAVIKNGHKDAKPIYRVQIEGFGTESEAKRFISKHRHTLNGAFLVRR